ncbi:MAG TPA: 3-hydroxyacyl-CoA dehydrogenase NAD-binding domain-containing protein, partial [Gammaproteobacteria bacterium]
MTALDIHKVGLLGGGVIGAGWAARFALNGIDVTVFDIDPQSSRKLQKILDNARRAYSLLELPPLAKEGSVQIVGEIESAVADAD